MRLLIQFRHNIHSVLTICKWSKVEASKEKVIRPCLLNKNQSQSRLSHETMRTVKSWGQFWGEKGGGVVS